jgi:hypothetical protein
MKGEARAGNDCIRATADDHHGMSYPVVFVAARLDHRLMAINPSGWGWAKRHQPHRIIGSRLMAVNPSG